MFPENASDAKKIVNFNEVCTYIDVIQFRHLNCDRKNAEQ
jgi:hypothetical protein